LNTETDFRDPKGRKYGIYLKMKISLRILLLCITLPSLASAGEIGGWVLDSQQKPVVGASIMLCDQATGIPIDSETFKPFQKGTNASPHLATAITDEEGRFRFHQVTNGIYRLIAQSWRKAPSIQDLFAVNGKEIHLRGAAESIRVPSPQALSVLIKPLGTASVTLKENFPNNGGFLVISTKPLSADPILGFASWQGPFLQHAIGANRMPGGLTYIHGLPQDRIHLSVFSNDNNGGIGAGAVEAKAGETVVAEYIPIVCGWSNGRHNPPFELLGTFEEMKGIVEKLKKKQTILPFLKRLLAKEGIKVRRNRKKPLAPYLDHLQVAVTLPSGARVPFGDVLAAAQYIGLQKSLEPRKVQANKLGASTRTPSLPPPAKPAK